MHGELVAYGTVVQAVLEKREPIFIEELRAFLKSVDLPTTLYDLGYAYELKEDDLNTIISNTLSNSYSKNFVPKITPEALKQALIQSNQF
ncbi:glycerol dehydrogenase [compost metagenome]